MNDWWCQSSCQTMYIKSQRRRVAILASNIPVFITSELKSCKHAINTAMYSITCTSPGSFLYNCDIMLPIQCFTSWEAIHFFKKRTSLCNLLHKNCLLLWPALWLAAWYEARINYKPRPLDPMRLTKCAFMELLLWIKEIFISRWTFVVSSCCIVNNKNFQAHLLAGREECNKDVSVLLLPHVLNDI